MEWPPRQDSQLQEPHWSRNTWSQNAVFSVVVLKLVLHPVIEHDNTIYAMYAYTWMVYYCVATSLSSRIGVHSLALAMLPLGSLFYKRFAVCTAADNTSVTGVIFELTQEIPNGFGGFLSSYISWPFWCRFGWGNKGG